MAKRRHVDGIFQGIKIMTDGNSRAELVASEAAHDLTRAINRAQGMACEREVLVAFSLAIGELVSSWEDRLDEIDAEEIARVCDE